MTDLTDKQRQILVFIVRYMSDWGVPPTVREIMDVVKTSSPNGVVGHLSGLQRKGYIDIAPRRHRGIKVMGLRTVVVPDQTPDGRRLLEILKRAK